MLVLYKKSLKDNGVKMFLATENIPDTPEGIIMDSLLEGMSGYYVNRIVLSRPVKNKCLLILINYCKI